MKHIFYTYHPVVLFVYIMAAVGCTMLTRQPLYVGISFAAASLYSIYLRGIQKYVQSIKYLFVLLFIVSVANALLNQRGGTVLFKIGYNTVTLEALLYGLCSGAMLCGVLVWFQCYQQLITNDKFLFLFGGVAPHTALTVAMVLKWIPQTTYKMRIIRQAHKGLGQTGNGKTLARIKETLSMAGILMSWSMEDSIETADSMSARAYGKHKRTCFAYYAWSTQDIVVLCLLLALLLGNIYTIVVFANSVSFYPHLINGAVPVYGYLIYVAMLLLPLGLEGKERMPA